MISFKSSFLHFNVVGTDIFWYIKWLTILNFLEFYWNMDVFANTIRLLMVAEKYEIRIMIFVLQLIYQCCNYRFLIASVNHVLTTAPFIMLLLFLLPSLVLPSFSTYTLNAVENISWFFFMILYSFDASYFLSSH